MDEIIMRIIKEDVTKAKRIVSNPDIPVLDKLFKNFNGTITKNQRKMINASENAFSAIHYTFISCINGSFRARNRRRHILYSIPTRNN